MASPGREALIAALVKQIEAGETLKIPGKKPLDISKVPPAKRDQIIKGLEKGDLAPKRAGQLLKRFAEGGSMEDVVDEAQARAAAGPQRRVINDTSASGAAGEQGFSAVDANAPTSPSPIEELEPEEVVVRSPEDEKLLQVNKDKIAKRAAYALNPKNPPKLTYEEAVQSLEGSLDKLSGEQLKSAQVTLGNLREMEKNYGITSKSGIIPDEAMDEFVPAFRVSKKESLIRTAMRSALGETGGTTATKVAQASGKFDPKYLLPSLLKKVADQKPLTHEEAAIVESHLAQQKAGGMKAAGDAFLDATEGGQGPLLLPEKTEGGERFRRRQAAVEKLQAAKTGLPAGEAPIETPHPPTKAVKPKPGPVANILGMLLGTDEIKTGAKMLRKPGILPKLGGAGILGGLNLPGALLSGAVIGGIGSRVQQMTAPSPVRDNVGSLLNRARLQEYQRAEAQKNLMQNPDLMAALTKQLKGAKIARTGEVPGNTTIGGDPSRGTFQDPEGLVDLLAPKE